MKEEFFPTRQGFAVPKDHSYLKLIDQGYVSFQRRIHLIPIIVITFLKQFLCNPRCWLNETLG